jgi:hypothetical protein
MANGESFLQIHVQLMEVTMHNLPMKTLSLAAILFLVSCNLPKASSTPSAEQDVILTLAFLTVQAKQTEIAILNQPTGTSIPPTTEQTATPLSPTITQVPTDTIAPSITPPPPPTVTKALVDKAQFIKDVSVEDNTKFAPDESFTKTWRLKNIGTSTWTSDFSLAFDSGDSMSGPSSKPLTPGTVAPGEVVDVSVKLVAPSASGHYRGDWKLRNSSNVIFGSIYVEIVVGTGNDVVYDFTKHYCDAKWRNASTNLSCPGTEVDDKGFVLIRDNPNLENDAPAGGKVLETHPQWIDNGKITGKFPAIMILPGDRFTTKIGCLQGATACNVKFQLNYHIAGGPDVQNYATWTQTYDGNIHTADVDLDGVAGQEVQFILTVLANGQSTQDWAFWQNPKILR